jgi:hypothetical protein
MYLTLAPFLKNLMHYQDDLRRLIGAIHGQDANQGNDSHGILGKEWDRSMDQELNELKEAEEAMRPGRRVRPRFHTSSFQTNL